MNLAQTLNPETGKRFPSGGQWILPYYVPTLREPWLSVRTHKAEAIPVPIKKPQEANLIRSRLDTVIAVFNGKEVLKAHEIQDRCKGKYKNINAAIHVLFVRGVLDRTGKPQNYGYSLK